MCSSDLLVDDRRPYVAILVGYGVVIEDLLLEIGHGSGESKAVGETSLGNGIARLGVLRREDEFRTLVNYREARVDVVEEHEGRVTEAYVLDDVAYAYLAEIGRAHV